jgi:hypothetical protein
LAQVIVAPKFISELESSQTFANHILLILRKMVCGILFAILSLSAVGFNAAENVVSGANPIRKIVTLLQNMQKEVEAEGATEKKLFDKFMCFCSGNNGDLKKKEADVTASIESLSAILKSTEAEKVQLGQDLIAHKKDREGAEGDIEEATMLREKEAAAFAAEKVDSETNIGAMASAIPALEKGMGASSLLQLPGADRLKKLVQTSGKIEDVERRNVMAFLEQNGDYAPQSGQIVGILKGMKDDMEGELKEAVETEEKAIAGFEDLKASKSTEIKMATEAIEAKTLRSGEAAVTAVQTKDALEDAKSELADTQKFLGQLATECKTKETEFAERSSVRAEEVKAISEAIAVLNDDDALDVFKAARGAALNQDQFRFLQTSHKRASIAQKAQATLAAAANRTNDAQLKVLLFTLNSKLKMSSKGKTKGLEGVIKMVDEMVVLLGKDQATDDKSKAWCEMALEKGAEWKGESSAELAQVVAKIEELTDSVDASAEKIATLEADIKSLDKAVAEATETRKEEHADFLQSQQLNEAATQLIKKAQQRLQKFYNPTLYKAPPKTEMNMEEKIIDAGTFAQIRSYRSLSFAEYKKSEKSAGVIGLMDMMIKEIATDMKDAEYGEKTSATGYADLMSDSEASRTADSKAIVTTTVTKAKLEAKLEEAKEKKTATDKDIGLYTDFIGFVSMQCDFLLQNYGLRKEARENEVESLKTAKAILSGASY